MIEECECQTWAGSWKLATSHHRNCEKYDPEGDAVSLISGLIDGMNKWASDEDGIHPEAWEAYKRASFAIGRTVKESA